MTSHMEQKLKLTHRWTKTPHFKQTSYASSHAIFLACYPGGKWMGFKEARWAGIARFGHIGKKTRPLEKIRETGSARRRKVGMGITIRHTE